MKSLIFKLKQEFFNDAINYNVNNPNKLWADMHEPIYVLPITSLILERHVNLHLKAYLELNSLFFFRHSGFREHHSCQTALIKIIDDWLSAINENIIAG